MKDTKTDMDLKLNPNKSSWNHLRQKILKSYMAKGNLIHFQAKLMMKGIN